MLNPSDPVFGKWQREQAYLETLRQQQPELFVRPQALGLKEQLARVGIVLPFADLSSGVIKYYPFDFIVEERLADGGIVPADLQDNFSSAETSSGFFLHADLLKAGISTIDAIRELSRSLGIKETQIGYGGVKDAVAITAQRISISNATPEQLQALPEANFFLQNIHPAKDAISMNNITGNRFTILIRTAEPVDEQLLSSRLEELSRNGFWNFYGLQRFGNRLLSHYWGMLLLQGKEEKALRSFLCDPGPNDPPYFAQIRQQANQKFENWEAMRQLFEPFAFSMRYELMVLDYLKEFRHDYIGALRTIADQVKLWVYAYGSFLFNKVLSFGAAGQMPINAQIPLLLSNNLQDHAIYEQFLKADKIALDFAQNIRRFDFIRFTSRSVEAKLKAIIISHKIVPEGVVISFDLPKGAYATTFLSHIFSLDGLPASVQPTKYDLKELAGTGSITQTLKKLEKFMVIRQEPEE